MDYAVEYITHQPESYCQYDQNGENSKETESPDL